jgi:hypothetical protein
MKNEKLPRNIGTVLKSYQKVVEIDAKLLSSVYKNAGYTIYT